ncbi:MAG: hypothetical protein D6814_04495, partial [Calditrichaeota bacterium]
VAEPVPDGQAEKAAAPDESKDSAAYGRKKHKTRPDVPKVDLEELAPAPVEELPVELAAGISPETKEILESGAETAYGRKPRKKRLEPLDEEPEEDAQDKE